MPPTARVNESVLSPKQCAALKLLSAGLTINFTALILKVKTSTIRRWITGDAAFRAEFTRALYKPD